jgi:hydrogenase expression/formation protein HypE
MTEPELNCPLPLNYDRIVMAHGGGGRLMQELLNTLIQPAFDNPILNQNHDSAVIPFGNLRLAFTTDSYVVKPLFFPGGDIGKLAVCGTLNDLAMSGAKPLFLSCSLIIEEGFEKAKLQRIIESMRHAADQAGVLFVTGDTKVVDHGKGDGVYINTAGIGLIDKNTHIHPSRIQDGDSIIVSSDLGRHGIAVLLERENLEFEHDIESDCADLSGLVQKLLDAGVKIHCLRDLTRGGLASVLIELAASSKLHFQLIESALPICPAVNSVCELLGFDPVYIANEGAFVLFVPKHHTELALAVLRNTPLGTQAVQIGHVKPADEGLVTLENTLGVRRILDLLSGEQLPRIC